MEAACEHSDVCGRDALDGHDGKCILHSQDQNKNQEAFKEALEAHREEHGPDFRHMFFPDIGSHFVFEGEMFTTRVDFAKVIFNGKVTFRNMIFVDGANFSNTIFRDIPDFTNATIINTEFSDLKFERRPNFREVDFKDVKFEDITIPGGNFWGSDMHSVTFKGCDIKRLNHAEFVGATIIDTSFGGARNEAIFEDVTFSYVQFDDAIFQGKVTFESNTLGESALTFEDAKFEDNVSFLDNFDLAEKNQLGELDFTGCRFHERVIFVGENEDERIFANCTVSFVGVRLLSNADLRFRYADLSRCRFLRTDLGNADFTAVRWFSGFSVSGWFTDDWFRDKYDGRFTTHWFGRKKEWFRRVGLYDEACEGSTTGVVGEGEKSGRWYEVERLYRQLKRNYEERGDFPRGGDFHMGEKEVRRQGETHQGAWILLTIYRALSKYGERALPAALWLVLLIFGFALFYQGATTCPVCKPLAYSEAIVPSLEATFYPVRSVGFEEYWPQVISIVQRIISPILLALLALALRQRVKR